MKLKKQKLKNPKLTNKTVIEGERSDEQTEANGRTAARSRGRGPRARGAAVWSLRPPGPWGQQGRHAAGRLSGAELADPA